jgi:hypothetical protein
VLVAHEVLQLNLFDDAHLGFGTLRTVPLLLLALPDVSRQLLLVHGLVPLGLHLGHPIEQPIFGSCVLRRRIFLCFFLGDGS